MGLRRRLQDSNWPANKVFKMRELRKLKCVSSKKGTIWRLTSDGDEHNILLSQIGRNPKLNSCSSTNDKFERSFVRQCMSEKRKKIKLSSQQHYGNGNTIY